MTPVFYPFRIAFKAFYGLYFYFTLALLYPLFWYFLKVKKNYQTGFQVKRFWSVLLQIGAFSPMTIEWEDRASYPEGAAVICSNHSSYLDIILMYRVVPTYFVFMGKKELLSWPLFNIFFKTMDIAVHRKNPRMAMQSLNRASEELQKGNSIAIFPEGTIPKTVPTMGRFKDGAFKLAIENQVPIVPISFVSNWRIISDPDNFTGPACPGLLKVVVHKPIETKGKTMKDLVDLRTQTFNVIDQPLEKK